MQPKKKKKKFSVSRFFLYVFVVVASIIILYPYIVEVYSSFKDINEINRIPGTLLPEVWHWENYVNIWIDVPLAIYFRNSAILGFGATALCIIVAIPAGYALGKMHFRGKKVVLGGIITTQMFSAIVLLVGIYNQMVKMHLQDSLVGLILIVAAFNQAFAVWLLSGTFATIPNELEESARIDGCNRMQAMRRVILPLAAPGIVTAIVFVFINAWNEYTLTLILISTATKKTLNVGIHSFFGYTLVEWWYVFAASFLATLPILALFQVLDKHLVGGLTAGSVKG